MKPGVFRDMDSVCHAVDPVRTPEGMFQSVCKASRISVDQYNKRVVDSMHVSAENVCRGCFHMGSLVVDTADLLVR